MIEYLVLPFLVLGQILRDWWHSCVDVRHGRAKHFQKWLSFKYVSDNISQIYLASHWHPLDSWRRDKERVAPLSRVLCGWWRRGGKRCKTGLSDRSSPNNSILFLISVGLMSKDRDNCDPCLIFQTGRILLMRLFCEADQWPSKTVLRLSTASSRSWLFEHGSKPS